MNALIQHFRDFILEDNWPDFVNDNVSRDEFQGIISWHAHYPQKQHNSHSSKICMSTVNDITGFKKLVVLYICTHIYACLNMRSMV